MSREKLNYAQLAQEVVAYIDDDFVSSLANLSAFLKANLADTNWVGFYLMKNNELVLGPFQGLPACNRIKLGRGVCGKAAESQKSIRVADVEQFSDHIVCDANSKSELVIPMIQKNKLLGVLDLDSASLDRFDEEDQRELEKIVAVIAENLPLQY